VFVLVLTLQQTLSALRSSGVWRETPKRTTPRLPDPYASLDQVLARPLLAYDPQRRRDPFGFAVVVRSTAPVTRPAPQVAVVPQPPPPPPRPVLTSIVWDNDPRATIRYNNRDFSVRENSLFAEFRVRSITSTEVVLDRNGEPVVLTLRPKGE
jgi:hypothetical protein